MGEAAANGRGRVKEMPCLDWAPFQEEFPTLFRGAVLKDMAVGAGWFEVLWDLCSNLEPLARRQVAKGVPPFLVHQVKEKFGYLRFYMVGGTESANALIRATKTRSGAICEACGEPGNLCMVCGRGKVLCLFHELIFHGSAQGVGRPPRLLEPPSRPEGCTCQWMGGEFQGWNITGCLIHNPGRLGSAPPR